MGKIRGAEHELREIKQLFHVGGWGNRAPGSGTYIVEDIPYPYTELQNQCKFEITGIPCIDFGYDPQNYITVDVMGYYPKATIFPLITMYGTPRANEVRFIEMKTVRLRKSQLSKEKQKHYKQLNPKEEEIKVIYSILQKDKRKTVKREHPKTKKTQHVENPYYDQYRKSDFCMELQRTWYYARLCASLECFAVPVRAFLNVKFIQCYCETFIEIADLACYQDHTLTTKRDTEHTQLHILKTAENTIEWYWKPHRDLVE